MQVAVRQSTLFTPRTPERPAVGERVLVHVAGTDQWIEATVVKAPFDLAPGSGLGSVWLFRAEARDLRGGWQDLPLSGEGSGWLMADGTLTRSVVRAFMPGDPRRAVQDAGLRDGWLGCDRSPVPMPDDLELVYQIGWPHVYEVGYREGARRRTAGESIPWLGPGV